MAVVYKRNSNLRNTGFNKTYLDIYEPALTPDFSQVEVITLSQKYNKRPDVLAYELYGDPKFWWIFTLYNRNTLLDPINDFITDLVINVPTKNFIAGM